MAGESAPSAPEVSELLALALSRPREALAAARTVLADGAAPVVAAVAHQAAGVVLRHFGDIDEALVEFRAGLRAAGRAGDLTLAADLRSSYAVALVMAGRPRAGLAQLDAAAADAGGEAAGRIHVRRAYCLWMLGRNADGLEAARRAVALLRGHDLTWEARAVAHRALIHFTLGAVKQADRDYARAEQLFARAGQNLEYAVTKESRATIAFVRGDLPAALRLLDDAEHAVDELGVFEPELVVTRAQVLLAAGLSRDALAVADEGIRRSERLHGSAARKGELLFAAALAARAADDPATAAARSADALTMFRRHQRRGWAARAELALLDSRFAAGEAPATLLARAIRLAHVLEPLDASRASEAHLLAGRIALTAGRADLGAAELRAAGANRHRDVRTRATTWLARAVLAEAENRSADMLAACAHGLDAAETHLRTFGATEMRAEATAQGAELATLALRHAVRTGDGRRLLFWSERWRATALAAAPLPMPRDGAMTTELAALRNLVRRLDAADHDVAVPAALQHERNRLEDVVRRHALHQAGARGGQLTRLRISELRAQLTGIDLVEITDVDGELHAVVVRARHPPAMVHIGPRAAAELALAQALFALRRQGIRQARIRLDLGPIGLRLQRTLLGPIADALTAPSVVVVPTSRLHAVPWSLLPALRERAVTVAPSAAAWLRSRNAAPPPGRRVVLVGGPNLTSGTTEVRRLAERYPDAVVLLDGAATCERVLEAIDGAWLVHVAAHGVFRADSPLFSALELDDGPLTVYDLERLRHAPHRVVLSSCESAVGAPSGADEILGVVSALMALGSAGVVASVVPVDDPGTVRFMLALHERMGHHPDLGEVLTGARRAVGGDEAARYPAESFIALGA